MRNVSDKFVEKSKH